MIYSINLDIKSFGHEKDLTKEHEYTKFFYLLEHKFTAQIKKAPDK